MAILQKIFEFLCKLQDIKILLIPVMKVVGVIAGGWYFLTGIVPAWALLSLFILILIGGAIFCYYRYIRPGRCCRQSAVTARDAKSAQNINPAGAGEE